MKDSSHLKKSTRWLRPKEVLEQYPTTAKELRRLREERLVTYRSTGKMRETVAGNSPSMFHYSKDSLDAYFDKDKVPAEPHVKIVEKVVQIQSKGGDTKKEQGSSKTKLANRSQGGSKMRWIKGIGKDGKSNGQFRLNCGDFTVFEYRENGRFFYYLDYRDGSGTRHTKSLKRMVGRPVESREDAYEIAQRARNDMYERQVAKDDPDVTYSEYAPIFLEKKRADKTLRHYKAVERMVSHLGKWFGDLSLREISQKTAEKYRDHRRKTVEDPTIDHELGYLNQVLAEAKDDGIKTKLIKRKKLGLESSQKRQVFMTEEMEKIIWPLLKKHPPMEDLADFILGTAMRPVNILQLKWDDIRWDDAIAFVPKETHKNNEDAEYLLNDKVMEMLRRRQSENGDYSLVFYRYEGQRPKPVDDRWYQRRWNEVKEEANKILAKRESDLRIPDDLRFYDLKATCLSRAGANGATEFQLQAISNHNDTASLQRYVRKKALQSSAREFLNGNGKNGVENRSEK